MKMKTHYKYFYFEIAKPQTLKDEEHYWFCINNDAETFLGIVNWFPRWKQYCFFPEEEVVFSAGCLIDVVDFVTQLNELHNKERG